MALSNRIKEARLKSGLTQEQLANMIGTAKSTVTGYEKGNRTPPAATVGLIADATNVDVNFLYQDEVKERKENNVSLEEISIIKKYRDLDPHGKEMVDFTLQKEWERSTALTEKKSSVIPMPVTEDMPDYLKPKAARNDYIDGESEIEKVQSDLSMLDKYKKND